ncbi:MAG: glycine--tRNA ligase subunit beta, partial [Candidatus Omnitrophica bacterium]|nr:glycine--tRNA ligase subunit beta [Candidatus Omnitrophota bacterium]
KIKNLKFSADLLLEIGTEELPAAYLDAAIRRLREEAERLLRERHLVFTAVESFGTPRRLTLFVWTLIGVQRNPPEQVRGPSKQAAFDGNGTPTAALLGFLKSRGGALADITVTPTEKGDYVYLNKPERLVPAERVLPAVLQELVGRLRFPKTMRWDTSGVRFARPIRWLLALYGKAPIRFSVGELSSSVHTRLGGPKRPHPVMITNPSDYVRLLARQGVVLDPKARREQIRELVDGIARQEHGEPAAETVEHGLLDEVAALVERPVAMAGRFDPTYLALPRELLLASMAKYQRVFALQDASGTILPKFVAILDGTPRRLAAVCKVYEHILNARLKDSLLFWNKDIGRSLEQMNQDLAGVTFHEKWGSMQQKMSRLRSLSGALAGMWQLTAEEGSRLAEACECAKADLVSLLVKEFPTLQGVMGRHFARHAGKPPAVADAVGEQYLPLAGRPPQTLLGRALAILDKYDTLAAHFAIGSEPSGDQDPFGLRRCAQGIVEVAWDAHRPLHLGELFATWQAVASPSKSVAAVEPRLARYLLERLYTFDWPSPKPSAELISAVLASPCDDVVDAMERIRALRGMDGGAGLVKAAKVVERTRNILKGADVRQPEVDAARFQEPPERKLWELYQGQRERLLQLIERKAYAQATEAYGDVFYEPLHDFFEQVMVNVKEEAIQQNRLALMKTINTLYTGRVADLSKLGLLQPRGVPSESV